MAERQRLGLGARKNDLRVALLFADALAAIETAWSLLAAGVQVVAIVRTGDSVPLSRSRRIQTFEVTAPEESRMRCASDVRHVMTQQGIDHLMLLDDVAIALVENLSLPCNVIGPTGDQARLALDKAKQVEAARTAGFRVPHTIVVESPDELRSVEVPFVLKPADAAVIDGDRASRGSTSYCADAGEIDDASRRMTAGHRYLAQQVIIGRGRGVFGLAGRSGVSHWSGHRRIRMMNPSGSGSSACEPAEVPDDVAGATERLLAAASWNGLFMVELLEADDGSFWFVELNGRPWGSMALSRAVGLEYPAWSVALAEDASATLPAPSRSRDVKLARHLGRELMHLAFVLRGKPTRTAIRWPKRSTTLLAVLQVRRGTRWYNWERGELAVFVADTWRTVRQRLRRSRS